MPRPLLLGLWSFFALATLGFVVFLAGVLAQAPVLMVFGAALLGLATVLYLFTQFWSAAGSEPSPRTPGARPALARAVAAGPTPAPPRDRSANFEHLMSHTLERIPPPEPMTPDRHEHASVLVAPGVSGSATESALGRAPAPPRPPTGGADASPYGTAALRRKTIFHELPLVARILDDAPPVAAPPRNGRTRGRCSGCDAILGAPAQRPLRLRCPRCGRTALLSD